MDTAHSFLPVLLSVVRYFVFAGIAYFIFYKWKKKDWLYMKIQQKFPEASGMRREMLYSLCTGVIFGLMATTIVFARLNGYTMIYTKLTEYGWLYLLLSPMVVILVHDTYFYWTHRLMHHPKLFLITHKVHHLSHNPTPWAAFAFHPIEAIIEAAFFPVLLFIIPLHPIVILIFMLYMIVMNVLGHTGYEFFPKGAIRHPILKWYTTPTHHNMHHKLGKGNYGLYFNFWDRIMNTNHDTYEDTFDAVKERKNTLFNLRNQ